MAQTADVSRIARAQSAVIDPMPVVLVKHRSDHCCCFLPPGSELAPQRARSMGDEEAGETVADLPRFEADAEAIREADLRAAAAATSARGDRGAGGW